jgi:hypothetical protein
MAIPYSKLNTPIRINAFLIVPAAEPLAADRHPMHHIIASEANKPMCTHLSNHILSSQFSVGIFSPGRVNRNVQTASHPIAAIRGKYFFVKKFFAIIKDKAEDANQKRGAPEEAPV